MGNKFIYLLFTRSNTLMSRAIFTLTNDEYTHVSISTDERLESFYSFGRRKPNLMLPAGFTRESVYAGLYLHDDRIPCKLVKIRADAETIERMNEILAFFYEHRFEYKYSIIGTILCRLGITYHRDSHRFCSQFVSELLQECSIMTREREPSLIRPSQLAEESFVSTVFEGDIGGLRDWIERFCSERIPVSPYVVSLPQMRMAQ